MLRLPSHPDRACAGRAAIAHALAACVVAGCGVDPQASLGSVPQRVTPPAGAGASTAEGGSGGAGLAGSVAPEAGSQAPPPPPSLDAGPTEEPPPPSDAGLPPEPPPATACAAPQRYLGDFACTLMMPFPGPPGSGPPPTMNATLAFALAPSSDDAMAADIVDGDFTFVAWEVAFMGRLEGRLDCVTGGFSATIVDGMTGAVFGMPMEFVGELDGMRVDDTGRLEGTWWHGPAVDPASGCSGPWAAIPQ